MWHLNLIKLYPSDKKDAWWLNSNKLLALGYCRLPVVMRLSGLLGFCIHFYVACWLSLSLSLSLSSCWFSFKYPWLIASKRNPSVPYALIAFCWRSKIFVLVHIVFGRGHFHLRWETNQLVKVNWTIAVLVETWQYDMSPFYHDICMFGLWLNRYCSSPVLGEKRA